ncbi:TlpA family protein disulfide reductase [Pseudoroseicyclus aestuarii]|uniref:Thiol-disulfide isomerase/thioredoxin n=1 Tax=Pseudoroseicyclus aestuarii TaxID=1795041 RepID=A0A318STI6_9RHOB|nr:TlpA disulfide reductase family protein [Pseudoroseicyclus aestuarii]PYE84675.1 thiol-disulfide isomerase/thioredoxin [Pseudoroseicyclus aestuarii]
MRIIAAAAVYLAATTLANAQDWDPARLEPLLAGDMRKLALHEAPMETTEAPFQNEEGQEMTLADLGEGWHLVNFWATWCAPCRVEMPHLAALGAEMGGEGFDVVTIAVGRNDPAGMAAFLEEAGAEALPRYTDPRQGLSRQMGILGLPVTVILDPEGREVARLQGEADWNAPEARALIAEMTGG